MDEIIYRKSKKFKEETTTRKKNFWRNEIMEEFCVPKSKKSKIIFRFIAQKLTIC